MLTRLDEISLQRLLAQQFAPADYVAWLRENGWGTLGPDSYVLYSALTPMQDVHDMAPPGYWSFGDDMSGYSGCFAENGDGLVYEWDSSLAEMDATGLRFAAFIARHARAP